MQQPKNKIDVEAFVRRAEYHNAQFRNIMLELDSDLEAQELRKLIRGHFRTHNSQPIRFNNVDFTKF